MRQADRNVCPTLKPDFSAFVQESNVNERFFDASRAQSGRFLPRILCPPDDSTHTLTSDARISADLHSLLRRQTIRMGPIDIGCWIRYISWAKKGASGLVAHSVARREKSVAFLLRRPSVSDCGRSVNRRSFISVATSRVALARCYASTIMIRCFIQ